MNILAHFRAKREPLPSPTVLDPNDTELLDWLDKKQWGVSWYGTWWIGGNWSSSKSIREALKEVKKKNP